MKLYQISWKRHLTTLTLVLIYAFLVIGVAVIVSGCQRDSGAGVTPANAASELSTAVTVADISTQKKVLPIRTSGRLASKAEVKLSFKIGGLVDQILVDEGTQVRKGAVLARLNMAEIDAQVLQAQSGLDKSRRDLERAEGLYKDSVATLEQLQDAQTGVDIAAANVKIASFNRKHAEILAPASGRILKRTAEMGELVGPGQPIYLFGAKGKGWVVRLGLADRDIVKLALGDSARLAFDAWPDKIFKGWVTELADAADPMSGTFEVEVTIDDPEQLLKSGFIARVDLYPAKSEKHIFLPIESLVEGNGDEGVVFVIDEASQTAVKMPVQVAELFETEIAIEGDLGGYQQVITRGAGFLSNNASVRVAESTQ